VHEAAALHHVLLKDALQEEACQKVGAGRQGCTQPVLAVQQTSVLLPLGAKDKTNNHSCSYHRTHVSFSPASKPCSRANEPHCSHINSSSTLTWMNRGDMVPLEI
jgi:hypothetical protein